MNELQVFNNDELGEVRTVVEDNKIWFAAKDICDVLEIADHNQSTRRLDDDEKGMYSIQTPGGLQKTIFVNEPGMYNLVLKSRKSKAKKFKRWLTHDVIPSIREKGFYASNTENKPQNEFDFLRRMLNQMENNAEKSEQALVTAQTTQETLSDIQELLATNPKDWRDWINRQFSKICNSPKQYGRKRNLSYSLLEKRAGCNLNTRLNHLKDRAALNGYTKTKVGKLNKLDVISQDKKLKEIYISIVKELRSSVA